jgi:uncharacterized damage-inducible protein DinB
MMIMQDSLDLNPPGGGGLKPRTWNGPAELAAMHEAGVKKALEALAGTTDDHLMTKWQLLVGGQVVSENLRHVVIEDTFTHLAHHRGQLSVYLRLKDVPLPSIYGPSADDRSF